MLTVEQCEMVVREGEEIGSGADRTVFAHDDFPEWVVKYESPISWREQNKQEYNNYLRLTSTITPVELPAHVRIPKTYKVGGFIVQQFVSGDHPEWDECDQATDWQWVCHCSENGLPECFRNVPWSVSPDIHDLNVIWDGHHLWIIDLGV